MEINSQLELIRKGYKLNMQETELNFHGVRCMEFVARSQNLICFYEVHKIVPEIVLIEYPVEFLFFVWDDVLREVLDFEKTALKEKESLSAIVSHTFLYPDFEKCMSAFGLKCSMSKSEKGDIFVFEVRARSGVLARREYSADDLKMEGMNAQYRCSMAWAEIFKTLQRGGILPQDALPY